MRRCAVLVLVVAGCDAGETPAPPEPAVVLDLPFVLLQRTACYGTCPVYTLAVHRSGRVRYEGEDFVKTVGEAVGRVSPMQIAALDELFRTHGYAAMADEYLTESITDSPTISTVYQAPGSSDWKLVVHYSGDMTAPPQLHEIEIGIDRIVGTEQWVGTREERLPR